MCFIRESTIEIWSDSFNEGEWFCSEISNIVKSLGGCDQTGFLYGFVPTHTLLINRCKINLIVYGSYKSWIGGPSVIDSVLEWGKPDIIAYDASSKRILFCLEETSATPTGNQALQRCERQYGSSKMKIPFWYLIGEYAKHIDGGTRRDSIWPSVAALKLSILNRTPSIVLHFSDIDNPEDYSKGTGVESMFNVLFKMLLNVTLEKPVLSNMINEIQAQYADMLRFVLSQWKNIVDYLPGITGLKEEDTEKIASSIAEALMIVDPSNWAMPTGFLEWPLTSGLPKSIQDKQSSKPLLKYDRFCELLEEGVGAREAYTLSNNAGSGRPVDAISINTWVNEQRQKFATGSQLDPPALFTIKATDFPTTGKGHYHITTSKNIVYLYDRWIDVKKKLETAFPRLKDRLGDMKISDDCPTFVYVCNSLLPGRLFGDPYTGQLSAYSTLFGASSIQSRVVVAYYPHQVHTQLFSGGRLISNKGVTLMTELLDLAVFQGGVAVHFGNEVKVL